MENIIVKFDHETARILHNPENLEELKKDKNCLFNPEFWRVEGLPPHLWQLKDGEIYPKDGHEKDYQPRIVKERTPHPECHHMLPDGYMDRTQIASLVTSSVKKIQLKFILPLALFSLAEFILLILKIK